MRKFMALASLIVALVAQPAIGAENYGGIPEKFFGLLSEGKGVEALQFAFGTNPWLARSKDQIDNLSGEIQKLDALVGKYIYHELLVEEKVGTRYVQLVYVVGYDRQPLRFVLRLYKTAVGWTVQGVSFDAKLMEDVDKAANLALSKH